MISDRGISLTVGSRHFIRYKYHYSVLPPCEGIPLSTSWGRAWLPAMKTWFLELFIYICSGTRSSACYQPLTGFWTATSIYSTDRNLVLLPGRRADQYYQSWRQEVHPAIVNKQTCHITICRLTSGNRPTRPLCGKKGVVLCDCVLVKLDVYNNDDEWSHLKIVWV